MAHDAGDTPPAVQRIGDDLDCPDLVIVEFGFFFFQAEDGIRDYKVTGVQTCALPISGASVTIPFKVDALHHALRADEHARAVGAANTLRRDGTVWEATNTDIDGFLAPRSEERRVGKECRSRWSPYH